MWSWKALGAVIVTAGILGVPFYFYWDGLTKGMRPPEATLILNRLEREGIPNFSVADLDGKSVSLQDFKGKILLINIWATWCAPCVKEFPSLKGLVEHFKGDVVVLAISHDKTKEDIDSFIKTFGGLPEGFVVTWDKDRSVSKIFGTDALPETYILSREQKLLRKIAGDTVWNDPMALQFFDELLVRKDSDGPVKDLPKPSKRPDKIETH